MHQVNKGELTISDVITADWFNRRSTEVAVDLLGHTLVRQIDDEVIRSQIVETEAYEAGDPAMHQYQKKTERNAVVFGPAGFAYVYRIYRQYHCFNIVTDRDGFASTILIRAVQLEQLPSWHIPKNKPDKLEKVAAGPGKLCRELKIDERLKGIEIAPQSGLWVEASPTDNKLEITQTNRIGLSQGTEIPWRWYLTNSPAVSRK